MVDKDNEESSHRALEEKEEATTETVMEDAKEYAVDSQVQQRPNLVLVLTDDQDVMLGGLTPMRQAKALVADAGVLSSVFAFGGGAALHAPGARGATAREVGGGAARGARRLQEAPRRHGAPAAPPRARGRRQRAQARERVSADVPAS